MPAGGDIAQNSRMTPGRSTRFRLDIPETVLLEPPFALTRDREEIVPSATASVSALSSGVWALTPTPQSTTNELGDPTAATVRLANMRTAQPAGSPVPSLQEVTTNRPPDSGTFVGGMASGGYAVEKVVPAGASVQFHDAADAAAFPQAVTGTNVFMERQWQAPLSGTYLPNTGWDLRFWFPGADLQVPDTVCTFYFGGPIFRDGGGEYAFSIGGDGTCLLAGHLPGTSDFWTVLDSWKFEDTGKTLGQPMNVRIVPHLVFGAPAFSFQNGTARTPPPTETIQSRIGGGHQGTRTLTLFGYLKAMVGAGAIGDVLERVREDMERLRIAAGEGPIRMDVRQDLRARVQVNRLTYPTTGTLVDSVFSVPFYPTSRRTLNLYWYSDSPDIVDHLKTNSLTYPVTAALYDASTQVLCTEVAGSRALSSVQYKINPNSWSYYVVFTFGGDGNNTPTLAGYRVVSSAVQATTTPTEVNTGFNLRSVNLTGPTSDPSLETGSLEIEDPRYTLSKLSSRAEIACSIDTTYDPNDATKRSALFTGTMIRAEGKRWGTPMVEGAGSAGITRVFPSKDARNWQLTLLGMWQRLSEQYLMMRLPLFDPTITTGILDAGYKVTDLVFNLLGYAGFPRTMIDVPDNPVKFIPTPGDDASKLMLEPLTSIVEVASRLLRDYLGWYLFFDPNAGTGTTPAGMWRVKAPPNPNVAISNIATFTTQPPVGKLPHTPGSYAALTYPILKVGGEPSMRTWITPPEANAILMVGFGNPEADQQGGTQILQWLVNPVSYNFFAQADGTPIVTADQTSPDYIGHIKPLIITEPVLATQGIVNMLARRYYDLCAHARKSASFMAPLVLLPDGTDQITLRNAAGELSGMASAYPVYGDATVKFRPLRYLDPVGITDNDGVTTQWFIMSADPVYLRDTVQMCRYEVMAQPAGAPMVPIGSW